MHSLDKYVKIVEALDDENLYWKIDNWFSKDEFGKNEFKQLISNSKKCTPLNREKLVNLVKDLKLDIKQFIDYQLDNINGEEEISDYLYLLQKVIETILANKNNEWCNYDNVN